MSWVKQRIAAGIAELNALAPEQRTAFARQAHRRALRRHPWRVGLLFLPWLLWVPLFIASGVVFPQAPVAARIGWPPYAILVLVIGFWIVIAIPIMYWSATSWERFAIRLRIAKPECAACGFSLVGLPRENAVVTCPECGMVQVVV